MIRRMIWRRKEESRSQDRESHFVRATSIEIHMDMLQEPFYVWKFEIYIQENCRTPIPRHRFCASLRNRNAHGYLRRAILCEIYKKIAGRQFRGQHFVRACAVETHTHISQICRENAGRVWKHLGWTPGLNPHRKNPFNVATICPKIFV